MRRPLVALLLFLPALVLADVVLKDETVRQGVVVDINCSGAGVTCSRTGSTGNITVAGASGWDGGTGPHTILGAEHTDTAGAGAEAQGDVLYRNGSSQWTRLAAGTSAQVLHSGTTPSWSAVADADLVRSYSGVGSCSSSQWARVLTRDAAPTCSQPDYSDLTGTPTLRYQTVQEEGSGLTQRATLNFIGPAVTCADNSGSARTDCTVAAAGVGACSAGQYATGTNNGAAPTCAGIEGLYDGGTGTHTVLGSRHSDTTGSGAPDNSVLLADGGVWGASEVPECMDGGSALTFTQGANKRFGCVSTTVLPTLTVTDAWTTVLDCDFTAESTQTITADGNYTVCGRTWTAFNKANSSTFAVTNGTGLQITSASNKSWPLKTGPTLYITASNLFSGTNVRSRTPLRAEMYATTRAGSITGDLEGMIWSTMHDASGTGAHTYAGGVWRYAGVVSVNGYIGTNGTTDSTFFNDTLFTTEDSMIVEWPGGYATLGAAVGHGNYSGGTFPAYDTYRWVFAAPMNAKALYGAGGYVYGNEFNVFAAAANGGTAAIVVSRLRIRALLVTP